MSLLHHLASLRHARPNRTGRSVWPSTTVVDAAGRLCVGGVPLTEIADEVGTPCYVLDEADFRSRIRRYQSSLPGVRVVYAGKALLTTTVAQWVVEEGLGLDVSSPGELAIALAAGVDPARIVLHGNVKTTDELLDATAAGVGRIVVDSLTELSVLGCLLQRPQKALLRVTPEIDIPGHRAVHTGVSDQKFGFTLNDGHFNEAVHRISQHQLLTLVGLHCHLGSQLTDATLYGEAIRQLVPAMADIRAHHRMTLGELHIGGGHGMPYLPGDPELNLSALAAEINDALDESCARERFPRPNIVIEPGRAMSACAGVTVHRVVTLKSRPRGRTFVAVDGGMSDNPRVALYDAKYTVALANRQSPGPMKPVTIVGRHCEAGAELAREVLLPADIRSGDVLAFACTGAYHHGFASTSNALDRPPLVAVHDGRFRETGAAKLCGFARSRAANGAPIERHAPPVA
ncbi:MAG: diaminopimelate decarboxylase [Mycobacterium sp.]|jgi:diaminopimelate decarboxylase|nr:diaminopimelate decarboxylase [Mycobacterium sp.]